MLEPEFMDEVHNKNNETIGTVESNYTKNGVKYIDVMVGEKMYYKSPSANWKVTTKYID